MPTAILDHPNSSPERSDRRSTHRTTLAEKLALLGRGASPRATVERVRDFQRLFAYRYTGVIVTRVGQGPKAWTKLPRRLGANHVIRHLLGNRVPGLEPVWFGARSFSHTRWFAIDIDADQSKDETVAEAYAQERADEDNRRRVSRGLAAIQRRPKSPKPPFAERLARVETALRRMGINPANPRQVLSLPTPSGGRHLYVFLDGQYHLEQIDDLLKAAGLLHKPGEVELFPAVNRALRLPFGFVPTRPHDPTAWIQFVDDYRNGRIHRFSLATLRANLDRHQDRWQRQHRSVRAAKLSSPIRLTTPPILGIPKARRNRPVRPRQGSDAGIRSRADADALFARGIQTEGTRNQVLNQLAAHLIWFRHQSAEDAAAILTDWAMNPRHRSKDIAADLARGTRKVPAQVTRMCRWYETQKKSTQPTNENTQVVGFAPAEIENLRASLRHLDIDVRQCQAEFLLTFLAFAKRHGTPTHDGLGRDAAPAINTVVRKWPGCSRMNYKVRIDHAVSAGVLTKVKEKWHNPNGPGRARTYRLHVPVAPVEHEVLDFDAALTFLTEDVGLGGTVEGEGPTLANEVVPPTEENDANHAGERAGPAPGHPAALPEEGSDSGLGAAARERDPQRDAAQRLPRHCPRHRRALGNWPVTARPSNPGPVWDVVARERERLTVLRVGGVSTSDHILPWIPSRVRSVPLPYRGTRRASPPVVYHRHSGAPFTSVEFESPHPSVTSELREATRDGSLPTVLPNHPVKESTMTSTET